MGDDKYLAAALSAAEFIEKNLIRKGSLLRRYRDGEAKHSAYVDDYAFLIEGLINLYESNFDEKWILLANKLQEKQDELLWDAQEGGYFFSDGKDSSLIVRKKDFIDGALPSGNAVSIANLLRLHYFFLDKEYLQKAEKQFSLLSAYFNQMPSAFSFGLLALELYLEETTQLIIAATENDLELDQFIKKTRESFLPNKIIIKSNNDTQLPAAQDKTIQNNKSTYYLCKDHHCETGSNTAPNSL